MTQNAKDFSIRGDLVRRFFAYTAMEEFISKFLSFIRSIDERDFARAGIGVLKESLYRSFPKEFHEVLRTKFSTRTGDCLRDFFSKQSYLRNPDLIKADLETVLGAIDAMRILRLEVAIEPSDAFVDRIAGWVLTNLGSDIVLDIARDRTVVGGARIVFLGKYRENTLIDMVKNVFETKRDVVMKELL